MQGRRSFGFFFSIALIKSLNYFDTFFPAGNSTSSVTSVITKLLSFLNLIASLYWKVILQRPARRPVLPLPISQLSSHIALLARVQAKDKEEYHRRWLSIPLSCWQPTQNHRVWHYPKLRQTYMNQNNVLRFDIPVQYLGFMHCRDSLKKITNNKRSAFLTQLITTRHNVIELPITSQLQYGIEVLFISKKTISLYYIRMIKKSLNL